MRERQARRGTIGTRRLLPALIAWLAPIAIAGCGTAAGGSAGDGTSTSPATTPTPARLAPIIYRPAGLSLSQRVPLLIALHGSFGNPQRMEGLTHFEKVAAEHGFVVAYLASSDLTHPWKPAADLTYISSMIGQITAGENIDPARVYVTGYSAGGAETWRAACRLSRQVAAIAVVSDAMSVKTLAACSPTRPVSELLIIGASDTMLYQGIRGRLPSAAQTTANWRRLDGCASAAAATQAVSGVDQQIWPSCTDATAVGLYVIPGAGHVWPPYGPGAPLNYPTSEQVWAFLSAHRAAPSRLPSSDVKLLSLRAGVVGANRMVISRFRLNEAVTIGEQIGPGQSPVMRKTSRLRRVPVAALRVTLARLTRAGRYTVVFAIRDSYGRRLTITTTIRVPALTASGRRRGH